MTANSAVSVNPFAAAMLSAAACLALGDPARAATLVEPDVTVLYALVPDQLGGSFGVVVETIGDPDGDGVMRTCTGTGENERLGFDALPLGRDPDNDWITDPDWQAFLDPWLERLARVAANP